MNRGWKVRIPVSAVMAALAVLVGAPVPIRLPLVAWFLLVCPGMAVVAHVGAGRTLTRWTLAIAVSVAIDICVAEVFLYARYWHPSIVLLALGVIATSAVIDAPLPPPQRVVIRALSNGAMATAIDHATRPFYVSDVAVALAARGAPSEDVITDDSPTDSSPTDGAVRGTAMAVLADPKVAVTLDGTAPGDPAA